MKKSGILWDNDGVLVDTEPLYYESTRIEMEKLGVDYTKEKFIDISLTRGLGVYELLKHTGMSPAEYTEFRERRDLLYLQMLEEPVPVREGIRDVLESCIGKFKMGIVTSSQRRHFDLIHQDTDLLPYFNFVLTGEDYEGFKPDPEPYLAGLRRIELPSPACLVIEDSPRGVASAHGANIDCLALRGPFTHHVKFDLALKTLENPLELQLFLEDI